MAHHELKCHPQFWQALVHGSKPFEVRRDDRKYRVGDLCTIREFDPAFGYVNRHYAVTYQVTFVLTHEDFPNGLQPGFVILGFGLHPNMDDGK